MDRRVKGDAFKLFRESINTNSFGLHKVFVMSKKGETYTFCTSKLNLDEIHSNNDIIYLLKWMDEEKVSQIYFSGAELLEKLPDAPQEVIDEVWK